MEQTDLLRHTADLLERLHVPYMVVGSYASIAYGEPRFTQDIDVVADLAMGHVSGFCAGYPAPEFYVSEPAVRDAVRTRFQFNVLHPSSGNKVDFILPRDDAWGRARMARRQRVRLLPDREVSAASPEDVIIGKLLYYTEGGSEKHLRDITGILRVSGEAVSRNEIGLWANLLGVSAAWAAVLSRLAPKTEG